MLEIYGILVVLNILVLLGNHSKTVHERTLGWLVMVFIPGLNIVTLLLLSIEYMDTKPESRRNV